MMAAQTPIRRSFPEKTKLITDCPNFEIGMMSRWKEYNPFSNYRKPLFNILSNS